MDKYKKITDEDGCEGIEYKKIRIWFFTLHFPHQDKIDQVISFIDNLTEKILSQISELVCDFEFSLLSVFWKESKLNPVIDKALLPPLLFKDTDNFYNFAPSVAEEEDTTKGLWFEDKEHALWIRTPDKKSGEKKELWIKNSTNKEEKDRPLWIKNTKNDKDCPWSNNKRANDSPWQRGRKSLWINPND